MSESSTTTEVLPPLKERKNSLQHALSHRPAASDLTSRQILHPGHPAILTKQHELEKAMTSDTLKKHLLSRPTQEELLQRNILPEELAKGVSPALLAPQKELERRMREDELKARLEKRMDVEDVVRKGILNEDENPTKE